MRPSHLSVHGQSVKQLMDTITAKTGSHLQKVPHAPTIPSEDVRELRATLLLEEALETIHALGFVVQVHIAELDPAEDYAEVNSDSAVLVQPEGMEPDIVGVVDGCCDTKVIATGTLLAFGVEDINVQAAVDSANLKKFTGDAHMLPNGKWQKPSDWQAPRLMKILRDQGYREPGEEDTSEAEDVRY